VPVRANLDPTHTAGVFQYDVVWKNLGPNTRKATHGNVAANAVAVAQSFHFVETALADKDGVAEIIDPYRTLGIKP